jgi:hypothetical protein
MIYNPSQFSRKYVSQELTVTSGGLLTLDHGFGVKPLVIVIELICKVAEFGYSVGDKIFVTYGQESSSAADAYGVTVMADSLNISILYGGGSPVFVSHNKASRAGVNLTNANWNLQVGAWA